MFVPCGRAIDSILLLCNALFAEARTIYWEGTFAEAARLFWECWRQNQGDRAAKIYWERCQSALVTHTKIKDGPHNLD